MKKLLLSLFVTLVSCVAFAQNVEISKLTTKWVTVGREDIEISYLDDKPYTGKVYAKHPNGKIGLIGEYSNGKKEGTWTYWYSTGEKNANQPIVTTKKKELHIIGISTVKLQRKSHTETTRTLTKNCGMTKVTDLKILLSSRLNNPYEHCGC